MLKGSFETSKISTGDPCGVLVLKIEILINEQSVFKMHLIASLLMLLLVGPIFCQQPVPAASSHRHVLSKCCPPGQTLDLPSLHCKMSPPTLPGLPDAKLQPPFLSLYPDSARDGFLPDPPEFSMAFGGGLPRCNPDTEDIRLDISL